MDYFIPFTEKQTEVGLLKLFYTSDGTPYYKVINNQPERLNPETLEAEGCDSLNTTNK
jgi:hypothetical protein